jgi:biopolymer transport protein TolR
MFVPEFLRRKKSPLMDDINVTPLVDVMLVLLIVFMIASPMLASQLNVRLPTAESSAASQDDDPIELSISKDKKIYILNTEIPLSQLGKKLTAISSQNFSKRVIICGDVGAPYGYIVEVVDKVKLAGFDKIGLMAVPKN